MSLEIRLLKMGPFLTMSRSHVYGGIRLDIVVSPVKGVMAKNENGYPRSDLVN